MIVSGKSRNSRSAIAAREERATRFEVELERQRHECGTRDLDQEAV